MPQASGDAVLDRILTFLSGAADRKKQLEATLNELQQMLLRELADTEQGQQVNYLEKAIHYLRQTRLRNCSPQQEIWFELWQAGSYETLGDWRRALTAYENVITLCDDDEYCSDKAEAFRWIGHIHTMQNQWADAFKAYQESLRLAGACGDEKVEANAYSGLAYYYFERGELGQAGSYWENALELSEKNNEVRLTAQVHNNLGAVTNVQGRWENALAHYGKSLPLFEKIGDRRGLAETHHNIAMTYSDAARWGEADDDYGKSYRLAKEIGDVRLQAMVKLNRVELYLNIGDTQVAEALCYQALKTFKKLDDHLGEADVYKSLGMIRARRQDWAVAKTNFAKSIKIAHTFKNPLCEAESHLEYGRMLAQKGSKKSAKKQYDMALELFGKLNAEKAVKEVQSETLKLAL